MKKAAYLGILIILFTLSGLKVYSQNCNKFHLYGTCMQYPGTLYKMDGQSRSNVIALGDKLIYNVIFYGERNYKLIFCTAKQFIPVHFVLYDSETREMIYDNKNDEYSETIELSIENTRRVKIEISILLQSSKDKYVEEFFGCVGFLLHWKPINK